VALVLQGLISKFIYASAFSYSDFHVGKNYDLAYVDPILVPLLGTEGLDCISHGGQYTRVEKTARIATIPEWSRFLDVCVRPWDATTKPNCSKCWKCMRTLLTLDVLDKLQSYGEAFDLDLYQNLKHTDLVGVLKSRDPLLREIAETITALKVELPFAVRVVSRLAPRFVAERIPGNLHSLAERSGALRLLSAIL
jgi:hypothetical protein